MKAEHVQENENNQTNERGDKQDHDDLVRKRLSLLYGWFEAFLEQALVDTEDDHCARHMPAKTTARNTQARHQSRVPAGKNSKPPKMATLKATPAINLKMDMCTLPLP